LALLLGGLALQFCPDIAASTLKNLKLLPLAEWCGHLEARPSGCDESLASIMHDCSSAFICMVNSAPALGSLRALAASRLAA